MARAAREQRFDPVDLRSTDVVLTGSDDLLGPLRAAASQAGVPAARMHVVASSEDPAGRPSPLAGLAVIMVRRPGGDPAFHRAHEAAERIAPLVAPEAVHIVITVSGVTRLAPKLERTLTEEVLHQLGVAGLRTAGVRVFRLRIGR